MSRKNRKNRAHQQRSFEGTWRPIGAFTAGAQTKAKVPVSEVNSLTVSAVYRAVNLLATTYASLPFCVHSVSGKTTTELPDHPLVTIFDRQPNEYMSSATFRETWFALTLLWGNGYAEIVRNFAGDVVELYIIEPWRVTPKVKSGRLIYEVMMGTDEFGNVIPARDLTPDRLLHIPCMGFNGIVGRSVIAFARESIGMAMAADQFGASFFGNGARPSGILEHPGQLGENAANRLRSSWQESYGGSENTGKVAILEEGMKFTAQTIPPEDAQFLETRTFQVQEIARWFGVPPQKLFDTSKSSYSTLEQMDLAFYKETVRPWLVKFEKEIERKLLPPNFRCEHNADELLRADTVTRYQSHAIAVQNTIKSPDEVRSEENYNPIEGGFGAMPVVGQNMVPISLLEKVLDSKSQPSTKGNDMTNGQSQDTRPIRSALSEVIREAVVRMVAVEVNALRIAAKKPTKLFAWADDFYAKHESRMRDGLLPAINAWCATLGMTNARSIVEDMIQSHIDESRSAINDAAGCQPNELAATIDQMVSRWETERVQRMVNSATEVRNV